MLIKLQLALAVHKHMCDWRLNLDYKLLSAAAIALTHNCKIDKLVAAYVKASKQVVMTSFAGTPRDQPGTISNAGDSLDDV